MVEKSFRMSGFGTNSNMDLCVTLEADHRNPSDPVEVFRVNFTVKAERASGECSVDHDRRCSFSLNDESSSEAVAKRANAIHQTLNDALAADLQPDVIEPIVKTAMMAMGYGPNAVYTG